MLRDGDGEVMGELPEFEVESPWWPDVEPVVPQIGERFGGQVHVLRVVDAVGGDEPFPRNGRVTYEAELVGGSAQQLAFTDVDLGADHPLRAAWARPGGVRELIEWADHHVERTGSAQQVKTWNLSCLLRLPTTVGEVWCKAAPPFFAHEGAVMTMVDEVRPGLVPKVLAFEPGRVLLAAIDGEDQWEAEAETVEAMISALVDLQLAMVDRVDELLAAGLPDWRSPALLSALRAMVARDDVRVTLSDDEVRSLDALIGLLPARLAALDDCGIPPSLVHGDMHRGNWRGQGERLSLLDWGDSGVGHPLLDTSASLQGVTKEDADRFRQRWRDLLPGDVDRALDLIVPIGRLRQALIYRTFLDQIEPSERRYHEADVPLWLREAIRTSGL